MSTYQATVTREGDWWLVKIDGVGITQARTLERAGPMARDLVAVMLDVPVQSVSVDVHVELGDLDLTVREARQAQLAAEAAQAAAAAGTRRVVRELKRFGLSVRDIATVMGVSATRVGQLTDAGSNPAPARRAATRAATTQKAATAKQSATEKKAVAPGAHSRR